MAFVRKCPALQVFWKSDQNILRIKSTAKIGLSFLSHIFCLKPCSSKSSQLGSYVQSYEFFWQESSELLSMDSTSIHFNLFILFIYLLLPRNCSCLVCFLQIWPYLEQSQGKTQKFQRALEETCFICIQLEISESSICNGFQWHESILRQILQL